MKKLLPINLSSRFTLVAVFIVLIGVGLPTVGTNEFDLKVTESSIKTLDFMPEGRDFYQKVMRNAKPAIFKGSLKKSNMGKATQNITMLLKNERFTLNGKDMPFSYWYNQSIYEDKEFDLRTRESVLLKELTLPIMLQCKEYKLSYDDFLLTIMSEKSKSHPKQIYDEMVLFSLGNDIRLELFDSMYSAELLVSMENGEELLQVTPVLVTLAEGDIIYIPKYWWIKTVTSGKPAMALKVFFNLLEAEGQQNEKDAQTGSILKDIEKHQESLSKLPFTIECKRRTLSLRHVLRINESDPKTLQLRLPTKAKRPQDALLRSGYKMPVLGLGTALLNEQTTRIVKRGLDLGYRLIDTAQGYPGSEIGIAQALFESSVPRSEIFIVTKLHPRFLGYNSTIKAIDMSLNSLNVDYIDLFLIHAKECDDFLLTCEDGEPNGTWQETWKAMEYAHKQGKIRSLGVSNFNIPDLRELQNLAEVPISVVQNWFDPIHQDTRMRKFCKDANIRYMGYSTLGGMWTVLGLEKNPILTSSLLTDLSTHYDYFVSSLVLSWAIHHNVTVIPRTANENHLAQNLRALDTKLSEIDISEIDSLATIFDDVLQDMQAEERTETGDEQSSGVDDRHASGKESEMTNKDMKSTLDKSEASSNGDIGKVKLGVEDSKSEEDISLSDGGNGAKRLANELK